MNKLTDLSTATVETAPYCEKDFPAHCGTKLFNPISKPKPHTIETAMTDKNYIKFVQQSYPLSWSYNIIDDKIKFPSTEVSQKSHFNI